jgi:hypothetical protein
MAPPAPPPSSTTALCCPSVAWTRMGARARPVGELPGLSGLGWPRGRGWRVQVAWVGGSLRPVGELHGPGLGWPGVGGFKLLASGWVRGWNHGRMDRSLWMEGCRVQERGAEGIRLGAWPESEGWRGNLKRLDGWVDGMTDSDSDATDVSDHPWPHAHGRSARLKARVFVYSWHSLGLGWALGRMYLTTCAPTCTA